MIIKDLIEFGLNEKEAKLYLALIALEVANVNEVAKSAGVNRSTAYVVLESLQKKGLVSISDDKKIRNYVAESPEVLLRSAEEMATKHQNILKNIQEAIPELKAKHKDTKQKPKVRVFEGKNGLISAFEDTLTCKEKVMRVSSSVGSLFSILPEYFPGYVKRRLSLGIKMLGIHPYDQAAKMLIAQNPKTIDEPVLIPESQYSFPADLAIYDDKIGYMSPDKGGIAIVIDNKGMADVMKNIFDMAFKEAKRSQIKISKK